LITAPDIGTATPYPSSISVSGVSGTLTKVTASLVGLAHTYPSDFEILLVGPGGQTVLLMSDAGDGMTITNVNLTFDDTASQLLPASQITSGTYKPTDYPPNDTMPA